MILIDYVPRTFTPTTDDLAAMPAKLAKLFPDGEFEAPADDKAACVMINEIASENDVSPADIARDLGWT